VASLAIIGWGVFDIFYNIKYKKYRDEVRD
jgi:hypothetical protein